MNRWSGTGNLGEQVTLRYTPAGNAVVNFDLAVTDGYGDKKQTYWIPCVAWKSTAEAIANYTDKGSKLGIEGKLTTRNFTDKDGKNRKVVEVLIDQVEFLSKKSDSSQPQEDPFKNESKTVDINDDDLDGLPF